MTGRKEFSIAEKFSPYPGGRRRTDGPFSGTAFREDHLRSLLQDYDVVVLNLDGLAGLPSSFWEEIFGGLIRHNILSIEELGRRIKLVTSEPELESYIPLAYKYATDAAKHQAH